MKLTEFLVKEGMVKSKKDCQRLIKQGGLKVNREVVTDIFQDVSDGLIQVGKRDYLIVKDGKNTNAHRADIMYELYYWDIISKEVFNQSARRIFYTAEESKNLGLKSACPIASLCQDFYEMSVQGYYLGSVDWDKVEEAIDNDCKEFGWFRGYDFKERFLDFPCGMVV